MFWISVATGIFLALLWFADVGKVVSALLKAEIGYILVSLVIGLGALLVWSVNWHNFFRISDFRCSFHRTFQLFVASKFINLVTPLGQFGGQPVMSYLISKESEESYERSLATLSSADLIVLLPISTFVVIGYGYLYLAGGLNPMIKHASMGVSGLAVFGIFMGYMGWYHPAVLKDILFRVFSLVGLVTGEDSILVERIDNFLENLKSSYEIIGSNTGIILRSVLIVHVSYFLKLAALYAVVLSLGIEMNVFQMMLLIPLVSVANFSPTPGGAGTFEAAMAGLLVLFIPVNLATAVTAAILYRISTYWMGITVGYISLVSLGITPGRYREVLADKKPENLTLGKL